MLKKRRMIFVSLILLQLLIPLNIINAKEKDEIYYINNNNVELTKEEYDFLSKFYWDGYQENMTIKDYQEFVSSDIINGEFKSTEKIYYDAANIVPYGTSHKTNSKLIKISASCKTTCNISVVVTWSTIPNTKSYDVIGAYLDGTKLVEYQSTTARTSTKSNKSTEIKKQTNGFGVSIQIPGEGTNYVISQKYKVKKGGTIYASYQHAKKSISLTDSKKYAISKNGYGGVFEFFGDAVNIYDQMGGVLITL